jgi:hypothetical protein
MVGDTTAHVSIYHIESGRLQHELDIPNISHMALDTLTDWSLLPLISEWLCYAFDDHILMDELIALIIAYLI